MKEAWPFALGAGKDQFYYKGKSPKYLLDNRMGGLGI
jgi:hypothetical protein